MASQWKIEKRSTSPWDNEIERLFFNRSSCVIDKVFAGTMVAKQWPW